MSVHHHNLTGLVPTGADGQADEIAVTCADEALTWAEFDRRTGRLASALTSPEVGVGPGDRVGVYVHKSIETAVAVHGILRAGAAYVPIDPLAPTTTVAAIVADCDIDVLVTHPPRRRGVEALLAEPGRARPSTVIGLDRPTEDQPATADRSTTWLSWDEIDRFGIASPASALGDDLAYIIYTSGSTGRPKGIMHTHRSGRAYAAMSADLYGVSPADRMASIAPLHFDQSTFELLAGPLVGARMVMVPEPYLRLPASLAQLLADQGCTTLYSVPSLFQQLLSRGNLADHDLSAVRWVIHGGEVFPTEALREFMRLVPEARFSNAYGPAEINQCTFHHYDRAEVESLGSDTLPVGIACPDAEVVVVDDEDRALPDGEPGELLVRGATLMAGYWNRPDLTEAAFFDRVGPGGLVERWYRTGDWGQVDERGLLRFHGRRDNQVKIRGNRLELEGVEAAIGSLDGVEQTVVGVRLDVGGDSVLVARYVPTGEVDTSRWRTELAAALPVYAVPSIFEPVEGFPLTPSGKIDRRTVRDDIAGSVPAGSPQTTA